MRYLFLLLNFEIYVYKYSKISKDLSRIYIFENFKATADRQTQKARSTNRSKSKYTLWNRRCFILPIPYPYTKLL